MPTRVEVIINALSGAGGTEEVGSRLGEIFRSRGIEAHISLAHTGDEIAEFARRLRHGTISTVVAGGGDGTISTVAAALVGTEMALGVLPLGTLNHFAKDLHIPLDLESAARNVIEGRVIAIDVGEVNERIFINNSSLGLYPSIVRRREKGQERLGWGKWPAFLWAALKVLQRYPFLKVRLRADDREFARRTPFVFVGNNEYQMESFNIGARASLDAGHLSLYTAHRTGRAGLFLLALRALFGRLSEANDFEAMCASDILIETRHRRLLRVATDGEVSVMRTPLHYRIRPGALRVIVPATGVSGEQ